MCIFSNSKFSLILQGGVPHPQEGVNLLSSLVTVAHVTPLSQTKRTVHVMPNVFEKVHF